MSFHASALAAIASLQRLDRRHQPLLHRDGGGDIHRRGKRVVGGLRHVDVIVGMHRRLAAERRAGKLAAAIGDHLVHVHVELRAAAGHPDMQRKHVADAGPPGSRRRPARSSAWVLSSKPLAGMVGVRRRLFQDGVGGDHLARHQILADAEMLERSAGFARPKACRRGHGPRRGRRFLCGNRSSAAPQRRRRASADHQRTWQQGCEMSSSAEEFGTQAGSR